METVMLSKSRTLDIALHHGNRLRKHAKLPRPRRPGYGKWTPRACKETGQRRRKENGMARKWTKEMEYGYK
jgi:hypothetical protein